MKKITPRIREQAAIYCSAMASWFTSTYGCGPWPRWQFSKSISSMVDLIVSSPLEDIGGALDHDYFERCAICYAEAEALLRTGWEP
jgi:hypothetical protein